MLTFLLLTKHGLKSRFQLDIPNYIITCNGRPRWKGGGAAILVSNNVKFGIVDTGSFFNADIEVITIILKNSQLSTNIQIYTSLQHLSVRKVSEYGVFSGPLFSAFVLNEEIYFVNLRIQFEYRKIQTRKNSVFGHFPSSTSDNNDDTISSYHQTNNDTKTPLNINKRHTFLWILKSSFSHIQIKLFQPFLAFDYLPKSLLPGT